MGVKQKVHTTVPIDLACIILSIEAQSYACICFQSFSAFLKVCLPEGFLVGNTDNSLDFLSRACKCNFRVPRLPVIVISGTISMAAAESEWGGHIWYG